MKVSKVNSNLKEAFENKGLEIEQFLVGDTKPNGKCEAGATALQLLQDKSRSGEIMAEINKSLIQHWDKYGISFTFLLSHPIGIGREQKLFKNYEEFEQFLLYDPDSSNLWMDYQWWQISSNKFRMSIHTLTTGSGAPRWTSVHPDPRLVTYKEYNEDVPDLYLLHSDESHFDIMIHKKNPLMDSINQENVAENKEKGSKDEKIYLLKKELNNASRENRTLQNKIESLEQKLNAALVSPKPTKVKDQSKLGNDTEVELKSKPENKCLNIESNKTKNEKKSEENKTFICNVWDKNIAKNTNLEAHMTK